MTRTPATAARSLRREQRMPIGCDTDDHGGAVRRAHLLLFLSDGRPTVQQRVSTTATAAGRVR